MRKIKYKPFEKAQGNQDISSEYYNVYKNIYEEGELEENVTSNNYLLVQNEGGREVQEIQKSIILK